MGTLPVGRNTGLRIPLGFFVLLAAGLPACSAEELGRDAAKEIIDAHLAGQGDITRDIPVGQGLHIAIEKAMDFSAPIRLDMFRVYQELERRGLVTMADRGGLRGFGGKVRTFDVQLTAEGEEALGPVHQGVPDYGRGASIYPIPKSYVRVLICKKKVREVTGIRIVKPGVEVEAEYDWHCADSSPVADLVQSAKKNYPRDAGPAPSEGSASISLALYDDGWRVAEGR